MNVGRPAACVNISALISQAPTVAFVIGASFLLSKVDASETSALVSKTASMEFVETGSASADRVGKVPAVTKTSMNADDANMLANTNASTLRAPTHAPAAMAID